MQRIVSVTTNIPSRHGFVWWACEVDVPDGIPDDDNATIDYIFDKLIHDGMLRVTRVDLDVHEGRRRMVRKRSPAIIGAKMVGSVMPFHTNLIEE